MKENKSSFDNLYRKYFRALVHKNKKFKFFILWLKEIFPIQLKHSSLITLFYKPDKNVYLHSQTLKEKLLKSKDKALFIDCGSNLGQGFTFFKSYYNLKYFDYVLFEPNPNCVEFLKNYPFTPISKNDAVQLHSVAVSDRNGSLKFYGISPLGGGIIVKLVPLT